MSASTALITDVQTAITTGPNATSQANAIAAAGPLMDLKGNLELVLLKLKEAKTLLTACDTNIDSGDAIQSGVTNVLSSLS